MLRLVANRGIRTFVTKGKRVASVGQSSIRCKPICKPLLLTGIYNASMNSLPWYIQKRYFSSNHEKYMKIEFILHALFNISLKQTKPKKERQGKIIQMNQFSVALIGRTNVGKSTLFNRLVGRKDAIVSKSEGTTRDRREGKGKISGLEFTLIDTGGYVTNYKKITEFALPIICLLELNNLSTNRLNMLSRKQMSFCLLLMERWV